MKLKIELIPETAYGQNLRSVMSPGDWQKLSRLIRNNSGGVCETCGRQVDSIRKMDAHEEWDFKITRKPSGKIKYVQRLKSIKAVCKKCHAVKHLGRTSHNGDYDKAVDWFMKVNRCSYSKFRKAEAKAYRKFLERSQHKWKLDVDIDKIWKEYTGEVS